MPPDDDPLWQTLTIRTLKSNLCRRLPHLNSLPNSPNTHVCSQHSAMPCPVPIIFLPAKQKLKDANFRSVEPFSLWTLHRG